MSLLDTLIDVIVDHKILNKESFTAWEVTTALRDAARASHDELKVKVHALFEGDEFGPGYARKLGDFKYIKGDQPWVYYPLKALSKAAPSSSVTAPIAENCCRDLTKNGRGSLCIPNSLVRQLGLKNGDNIFCYLDDNDDLTLSAKAPEDKDDVSVYTIDKSDNATITPYRLHHAGLDDADLFIAELYNGRIIVSPDVEQ